MTLLPVTSCKLVRLSGLRVYIVMSERADESPIPELTSQWFALTRICPKQSALPPLRPARALQELRYVILTQAVTAVGRCAYHQLLADRFGRLRRPRICSKQSMWKTLLNQQVFIEPADLTRQYQ